MDYNYYNYGNRKPISPKRKRPTKRRPHPNSAKIVERKLNKKKVFITIAIFVLIIGWLVKPKEEKTVETSEQNGTTINQTDETPNTLDKPDTLPVSNPGEEEPFSPNKEIEKTNIS